MHFVREIWLRHVKCAAAREGFISFHIATAGCNISQFSLYPIEKISFLCYNQINDYGERRVLLWR